MKEKSLSTKSFNEINSKNDILDRKSHIHSQNLVYKDDKSKKRKRKVSLLKDSLKFIVKNRKLT